MSKIAFKPEEATDALKEFAGQIVGTDYSEEPFGMKGAPDIKRTGKVLCVQIRTDAYEKLQLEWYPPSRVKKTKKERGHQFEDFVAAYFTGYLEAIIDGEGTITLTTVKDGTSRFPYRFVPLVSVSNDNLELLERLKSWCGGHICERSDKKEHYRWYMTREAMRVILPNLYLIAKWYQKDLLLEALDILNCRGPCMTEAKFSRLVEIKKVINMLNTSKGHSSFVKWLYFIEALNTTGAMRDISIAGKDDEERMQSLAKSLLGMTFRFEEQGFESLVRVKGGDFKKFTMLVPVEYLGKKPIEPVPEVRQATIGEVAEKPTGGID